MRYLHPLELGVKHRLLDRKHSTTVDETVPAVISLGAGVNQLPLIVTAKKMGWSVVAVDRDPNAPGFAHADVGIQKSSHDTESVIDALNHISDYFSFRGVVARTSAAEALHTWIAVSEMFGLPALKSELVQLLTEKSMLRKFSNLYHLPVPKGTKVTTNLNRYEAPPLPVLVKPDIPRVGKQNVRLCRDGAHLETYVADAAHSSNNHCAEVESYIEGIDATCFCLAHEGKTFVLTWWDELVGIDSEDRIVGLGVSVPSVIAGTATQGIGEQIVTRLVSNFPTVCALLLISFRITMEGNLFIIEVNSSLGGDLIADKLLPAANPHFDCFELCLQVATRSIQKVNPISFKPTALCCFVKRPGLSEGSAGALANYMIFQRGSRKENLALLAELVGAQGLELSVWPRPLEWFERNSLARMSYR